MQALRTVAALAAGAPIVGAGAARLHRFLAGPAPAAGQRRPVPRASADSTNVVSSVG
jgi:hypothetical protein